MDQIIIEELEVACRVGVPAKERAKPQRLLITVTMENDFSKAAVRDDICATIDYHAVAVRLQKFAKEKSWRLIETLAVEMADLILKEFKPVQVTVQIKKFILPETRFVGVQVTRSRRKL